MQDLESVTHKIIISIMYSIPLYLKFQSWCACSPSLPFRGRVNFFSYNYAQPQNIRHNGDNHHGEETFFPEQEGVLYTIQQFSRFWDFFHTPQDFRYRSYQFDLALDLAGSQLIWQYTFKIRSPWVFAYFAAPRTQQTIHSDVRDVRRKWSTKRSGMPKYLGLGGG